MMPLFTVELDPAEWVRVMRTRLGLTQRQLAKRLGVCRKTVNYYENGVSKISQAQVAEIRRLLDIS